MEEKEKNTGKFKLAGGSTGLLSAGLGIAGILFMPVSGGLSLGLTIAGVGTGLAAGGMTTGSDIYKKKKHRSRDSNDII